MKTGKKTVMVIWIAAAMALYVVLGVSGTSRFDHNHINSEPKSITLKSNVHYLER